MATFRMVSAGAWPERYTFSPAVRAGNLLFIAGTTATDDTGAIVAPGDIVGQTRVILQKFARLLAAAGRRILRGLRPRMSPPAASSARHSNLRRITSCTRASRVPLPPA